MNKDTIPFDEPGTAWSRTATRSAYETILSAANLEDPILHRIGALVRASELAYWALEHGSAAKRFDARLKELAVENDIEGIGHVVGRGLEAIGSSNMPDDPDVQ